MNSFEFNKIFAAFLCAGIVAMLGGFVSHKLVHPHKLYKNAVEIDGAAIASSGPAKPKMPDPVLHLIATADVAKVTHSIKAAQTRLAQTYGKPLAHQKLDMLTLLIQTH
jgi:hypothetical protein